MNDAELERNLKGVGKACFVQFYESFRDKSRTDALFLIDFLVATGEYKGKKYTKDGAKMRVRFAKAIFDAGRECDALRFCERAAISWELRNKAKTIVKSKSN